MGATIGVLAAYASSTSSACGVQDGPLHLQELTGRQWVAINLADRAIDGTHIPVSVPEHAHDDFINRKGFTSQNVLAVCDMGMRFTFVATGKKGAVHDTAVLREALNQAEHFPHPPQGKYYLVDSGYPLREGYMAPYRKGRYHLSEFNAKGPENLNEIFNYHHSCLRNVVERSFGVLKNKWQILRGIPLYNMEKQSKIIVACFALHNFALDNNEPGMVGADMFGHGTYLSRTSDENDPASDWFAATANDDISKVRDWIAAGLYGLT
ncbi:putative nuclease HARBI1 [Setaria italica]|uniref:putative nuclease HARBI1 n=1 Tax=Setaria italica TaxID=4555 RepID=UPI000BE56B24|nr:putative nuclease HARBI1 [Setaria italica]